MIYILCLIGAAAEERETFTLSPVIVTGTRTEAPVREIFPVDPEMKLSVPEALKEIPGLDLQTRGPLGAQADISIRGSTYQQILILIDGIRVNDPQTAHHNMDLPVPVCAIEKIEVLKGAASAVYGADAFGGVINIITKTVGKENISLGFGYGSNNTQNYELSFENTLGAINERVYFERLSSDGYRYDTDFLNYSFLSQTAYKYAGGEASLKLGYMNKAFGAFDFYTPGRNFPSKEWTKTYFAEAGTKNELAARLSLEVKTYFRKHDDTFMLNLATPTLFVNNHVTYDYGAEAEGTLKLSPDDLLVLGAEAGQEEIYSSNLGDHKSPRQAVFTELNGQIIKDLKIDAGLRLESSFWGPILAPSIALSIRPFENIKITVSAGSSFRSPSFTELYYADGVSFGNALLKPETAVSYELGVNYSCCENLSAKVALYARDETNLIDWVGDTPTGKWNAQNIGQASVYGVEGTLKARIEAFEINTGASFIYAKKDLEYYSKYALLYPAAQGSFSIKGPAVFETVPEIGILYKRKAGVNEYTLLNAKLTRTLGGITVFVEGQNLTNVSYEEIKGIPQPGITFSTGIKIIL